MSIGVGDCCVAGLHFLRELDGNLVIPVAVRDELQAGTSAIPAPATALEADWIHVSDHGIASALDRARE